MDVSSPGDRMKRVSGKKGRLPALGRRKETGNGALCFGTALHMPKGNSLLRRRKFNKPKALRKVSIDGRDFAERYDGRTVFFPHSFCTATSKPSSAATAATAVTGYEKPAKTPPLNRNSQASAAFPAVKPETRRTSGTS